MTIDLALAGLNHFDRARALADSWAEHNLYCPNCSSPKLEWTHRHPGDFSCPHCHSSFQFKGHHSPIGKSVVAGDYEAVTRAMRSGKPCGYFFMHYEPAAWTVRDLLLVPLLAVPAAAIARRTSRCQFLLDRIPAEARIAIVTTIKSARPGETECIMISRPEEIRDKFSSHKPRHAARASVRT